MNNPLFGKYISFNGDSICDGVGYRGGYAKIISEENSMKCQNIGVRGGTIAFGISDANGELRHCISDTVDDMDENADYAIIEGGANDATLRVPLGKLSEKYEDDYSQTTFYGAFEYMLKHLVTRFHGKKYGYIAVHQVTQDFRVINPAETSYYWAAKRCCEKWGVPFLDLNSTVPPFGFFKSGTDLFELREKYTYNADGLHPNEEGYRKYYVPKITEWLKTL